MSAPIRNSDARYQEPMNVQEEQKCDDSKLSREVQFPPFSFKTFLSYMDQNPPQYERALCYIDGHSPEGDPIDLLQWQNARVQVLQCLRDFDSATRLLEEIMLPNIDAIILNVDIPPQALPFMILKANAQLELAHCYFEKGNVEKANSLCSQAKELFKANLPRNLVSEALLRVEAFMTRIRRAALR